MIVKRIFDNLSPFGVKFDQRKARAYEMVEDLGIKSESILVQIEEGNEHLGSLLAFHLASRYAMRPEAADALSNFDHLHYVSAKSGEIGFEKNISYLRQLGFVPAISVVNVHTDGINHYNIYSGSRRIVGQMASNFFPNDVPYLTPHGGFKTIEGYYHYLRIIDWMNYMERQRNPDHVPSIVSDMNLVRVSRDYRDIEKLRRQEGTEAIRWGRNLKKKLYGGSSYKTGAFTQESENNFTVAVIRKLATLYVGDRMLGNVMAAIHYSGVPFTHYYVVDGQRHVPPHADWLPSIYTKIIEQIDPNSDTFSPADVADVLGLQL